MSQALEDIAGLHVCTLSPAACMDEVVSHIRNRQLGNTPDQCRLLACLNPHSFAVALDDAQFSQSLRSADWLVPDGVGIVAASMLLGGKIRSRVTGSDIFAALMGELNRIGGCSVFFLGSTEETLSAIRDRVAIDYPQVRVAGAYSPPFKPVFTQQELDEMVGAVNAAAPDVLWVGMTAPKQEKWIHAELGRLNVAVAAAVGAVFDFYTGRVKRSSLAFQRLGLEWLPRLVQQPRRLWRRSFVSAPIFFWHVAKAKVKQRRRSAAIDSRAQGVGND